MRKAPELLAPAGTLKHQRYAFAFGADAVYAGLPRYSLRARNNEYDLDNLATGIEEAHQAGKRFFVATNLLPHDAKVRTFIGDMEPVIALRPDALIMADPGLIALVRERWPEQVIHLSVQANTMNHAAVRFWQSAGVQRVILSRELSLDEIEEIRQRCPDMELETFVHGALCIAYSGRCLLSGYFNHRDANQGTCTNACRWRYRIIPAAEDESGDLRPAAARHPEADRPYLVEEGERPNELMPMFEDELGTYIMNSRDLRAVEYVQRLVEIGVDSLKIEGRTKSFYYAARTSAVYRRAIDDAIAGRPFDEGLIEQLNGLANRGYTSGFYDRHAHADTQGYYSNVSDQATQRFVAEVTSQPDTDLVEVDVKNKFAIGDTLELLTPRGSRLFVLEAMHDSRGNPVPEAPGGGHTLRIRIPPVDATMGLIARLR